MNEIFCVSMVIGSEGDAVAELEGDHGFTIHAPMQVPAVVLARAAGVNPAELPGMWFVASDGVEPVGD